MIRWQAVLSTLVLCTTLVASVEAAKTDIVLLRNGDRLTCEVQALAPGLRRGTTDNLGTINIEGEKVASVQTTRVFEAETGGGARYYGALAPAGPGQITIV